MSGTKVRCPFCRRFAGVSNADGFALVQARLTLHLQRCVELPDGFDQGDITKWSTHVAEAVVSAADGELTIN